MRATTSEELLSGKAVVITGGGRGLGRAYALACAHEGAAVVVNDRDEAPARSVAATIVAAGGRAVHHVGSVAEARTCEELVAICRDAFGGLDGLVANAAVKHEALPWDERPDDLARTVAVNVLGTQLCARYAMRAMVDQGRGGSVVTVVSGARLGLPGMSAYGASKGAVDAMTANWALAGRDAGIRVNAISPLADTAMARADGRPGRAPLPRAELVAPLVVALLSDAARGITGEVLRFDGTQLQRYAPPPLLDVVGTTDAEPWSAAALAAALAPLSGPAE